MPTPDYNVDLDLGEPPPELQEYARLQCGEDPNTKLQAIYELRDMIYERGECTPKRMDDEYLLRFLRARNFIPQRAHRLMVNYHQFKEDNPELFENVYPLDLRRIGDTNVMAVPPYRDQNGRRLLLYRIGSWDPKSVAVEDILKATIFALELGLLEQRTQILGGIALFDLEDLGTQHLWQVTPSVASKIIKLLVSSFPATTHAIHIINHSWIFDKMYSIFKPLLTAQMRSRIFFHGYDVTSLHEHIQPDYLPERYGGVWPDYPYTIWLESLKKNYTVAKQVLALGYKFREEEVCPEVVRRLKEEGIKLS
ncbi:alpha-tocopherol transfer protein [Danaus plexippus]|uniref:alpha-tocopherol transfer protein n=1 Tax=Danaus plexippus TaxID=13037 RepID=UPI002AB1D5E1|nr:alpha-tocopherol transfer protein [Danaus plexippus]XP_032510536.2 alpha-tocopherol transfer protein [Danaus plexippus]